MPTTSNLDRLREYHAIVNKGPPKARRLKADIVTRNHRLVRSIAQRMSGVCAEPMEDLIQIGSIGMLKAIDRFDPCKDIAFSSFAVPYIKGEIQHHLRDHWGSLKIPRRWREQYEQVERIRRRLVDCGRNVAPALIAESLGIEPDRWEDIELAFQVKSISSDLAPELGDVSSNDELEENRNLAIDLISRLPDPMRSCVLEWMLGKVKLATIAKSRGLALAEVEDLIEQALVRMRGLLEIQPEIAGGD